VETDIRVCLACGARAEPTARFCSQCGRPLDGEESEPVAYEHTPRRLFGVASPDALFAAACIFFVFAIVALVAGRWMLGLVLLAPMLALLVLFYGAARNDRTSAVARTAIRATDRARGWAGFGGRSVRAWTGAGRDILRLRSEARALQRERARVRLELGDAAYREDEATSTALRSRMHEIDDELAERERARTATVARARRRVEDEHRAVQPTRQLSVDETKPDGKRS
jgi:hypothetical protein